MGSTKHFISLLILLSAIALAVPPVGYRWEPVPEFSDEFNTGSLDASKWRRSHPGWSGRNSTFRQENVSVGDGCLQLQSTLNADTSEVKASTITAACVSSQKRNCRPGYYESRIQASNLSMTSSFWFQGRYSEIDVIENVGNPSLTGMKWIENTMMMNTHYFLGRWENDIETPTKWGMPGLAREDFHTYGVWWKDENTIWFYHDNVKVAEVTTGGPFDESMYLFFDTEVFTWHGWPTKDSLLDPGKNIMYVDWVRAWANHGPANLMIDSGFESGTLDQWSDGAWGTHAVNLTEQRSGNYCWSVDAGGIAQKIPLEPLTRYKLTAWVKVGPGVQEQVRIGQKDYGVDEGSIGTIRTDYDKLTYIFKTGKSASNGQVYAWVPAGMAYVDDFSLERLPPVPEESQ